MSLIEDTKKLTHKAPKTAFKKGHKPWNSGLKVSGNSGNKHSIEWKTYMSQLMTDKPHPKMQHDKHPLWKGDDATYRSVHRWVTKWKGQPDTCAKCGKEGLSGRKIHWANIDHKYRRVLDDYIRLCALCHSQYDKNLKTNPQ